MNSISYVTNIRLSSRLLSTPTEHPRREAGTLTRAATCEGSRKVRRTDIEAKMVRAGSAEGDGGRPNEVRAQDAVRVQASPAQVERFHALYRQQFDFVFRNLRRLGVPPAQVDDALQDVFLVVLRHLDKYEAGSRSKAWLFAIALRVASNYRRSKRRRDNHINGSAFDVDGFSASSEHSPFDRAATAQAVGLLRTFLDSIDDDKRSVFIMTELEQMSAPEIAAALRVNLNTVYARIRAARREFARAVARLGENGNDDGPR
jgi:RNA polymerase sigma-70 factor (ECF subfamily)